MNLLRSMVFALTALLACISASASAADWTLDAANSNLHFISVKKDKVGEVHTFHALSGGITKAGHARVTIDLTTVDTGVKVRDQRVKKYLFHTDKHPEASITASVDMSLIGKLAVGQSKILQSEAKLSLAGQTQIINTPLRVTRLTGKRLMVQPTRMLIVNAADYGLVAGVQKLAELAGLKAISTAVPVNFSFIFNAP